MGQALAALAHTVGDPCCEQEHASAFLPVALRRGDEGSHIGANAGDVFSITLTKTGNARLGFDLDFVPTRAVLPVRAVTGSLAEEWNRGHPDAQVRPGDRIVEVNGTRGVAERMMKVLQESEDVRITLVRLRKPNGTDDWEYIRTYHDKLDFEENMPTAVYELVPYQGDHVASCGMGAGFGDAVTGQIKSTLTVVPWAARCGPTQEIASPSLEPRPAAVVFQDPREVLGREVGLVGFHYPGREEAWDKLCRAGFLSSCYDLDAEEMLLETPCEPGARRPFKTAEAAFQALKFWSVAQEFAGLSGLAALQRGQELAGQEDFTYAGFGSAWRGMFAVLSAKFRPSSCWALALLRTGDAFLMEQASGGRSGRARNSSAASDSTDTENKLGIQLMVIRDRLSGESRWTEYLASLIDLDTGRPTTAEGARMWQAAVRSAAKALDEGVERSPLEPEQPENDDCGGMVGMSFRPRRDGPAMDCGPQDFQSLSDSHSEVPPSLRSNNGLQRPRASDF
mmetsp:Transcript_74106/g.234041  ORF Transcript_74106/g.234041 Transcript_74106/m.234041 type:complete len:509 (+) Transcript_74106:95-1621(+)